MVFTALSGKATIMQQPYIAQPVCSNSLVQTLVMYSMYYCCYCHCCTRQKYKYQLVTRHIFAFSLDLNTQFTVSPS